MTIYKLQKSSNGQYYSPIYPIFSYQNEIDREEFAANSVIPHDIIEHALNPHSASCNELQELEALGATWFFRNHYGIPANYHRNQAITVEDLRGDITALIYGFKDNGILYYPNKSMVRTKCHEDIRELLDDMNIVGSEETQTYLLDGMDVEHDRIDWKGLDKLLSQRMSMGIYKFKRRFKRYSLWDIAQIYHNLSYICCEELPQYDESEIEIQIQWGKGTADLLPPIWDR